MNRVCSILGIEKPVFLGPMASITTERLTAAVSEAGGLGVLGVSYLPNAVIREKILAVKRMTDKPFGVNLSLNRSPEELTNLICDLRPPVVYIGAYRFDKDEWAKFFALWHQLGCKIIAKVAGVATAVAAEEAGCDIVVAKGWEGGGRVTYESTMILVPQMAEAVNIPVVAAGGIGGGRGAAAALALGAEAVELGTVFMAATESPLSDDVKKTMIRSGEMSTTVVGHSMDDPSHQIRNRLIDEIIALEAAYPKREAGERVAPLIDRAWEETMMNGCVESGAVAAGPAVAYVKEIKPASVILNDIIAETKRILAELYKKNPI